MDYRQAGGPTCVRCGLGAAAEALEVRAEGGVCRTCCASEAVTNLDEVIARAPRFDGRAKFQRRRWLLPLVLLPYLAWGSCATGLVDKDPGIEIWLLACVIAMVGVGAGFWRRDYLAVALGATSPIVTFFLGAVVAPGFDVSSGRALRRAGVARVPRARTTGTWLGTVEAIGGAPPGVAHGWRINAAAETASVASFSHLATELLALGAPSTLVERAHEDALDEIRHARMCYALAARIDGIAIGPDVFPDAILPRAGKLTLASHAADCIVESCLYESASARVADALLPLAVEPAIKAALKTIAVDEARHAEHGREIVVWCIQMGGSEIVEACLRALAKVDPGTASAPSSDDSLERFGLAGPALWRQAVRDSQRDTRSFLAGLQQPRSHGPAARALEAANSIRRPLGS